MRIILCCLLLCVATVCCEKQQAAFVAPSKPVVLVSVPSYLYFVERIAGDTVSTVSLTPPGANPHIYEPTPREVQHFRQASLWIRLGEPSDQKTYTVLKEQCRSMKIVDIAEGISLLPSCEEHAHCAHHHNTNDLHIWLSPRLAQTQAQTIEKHLSELLPQYKQQYAEALSAFLNELQDLDKEVMALLASKSGSAVLVSHPAFAYFCKDYQISQLSIEVEGKEPRPQDVVAILQMAKKHKVAQIIAEPQYSDKGAQLIAENLHIPLYTIDPYSQEYMKNVRYLAEIMAR